MVKQYINTVGTVPKMSKTCTKRWIKLNIPLSTTGHSSFLFNISTQCYGNIYVTQLSNLSNPNIYDLKGAMYSFGSFVYDCLSTRTSIRAPISLITTDLRQLYKEKNRRACAYPLNVNVA